MEKEQKKYNNFGVFPKTTRTETPIQVSAVRDTQVGEDMAVELTLKSAYATVVFPGEVKRSYLKLGAKKAVEVGDLVKVERTNEIEGGKERSTVEIISKRGIRKFDLKFPPEL